MGIRWRYTLIPAALGGGCFFVLGMGLLAFFLSLLLVKLWWAWAIPDLLPGAVSQGLVADSLSWWTSFKLALALAALAGFAASRRNKGS